MVSVSKILFGEVSTQAFVILLKLLYNSLISEEICTNHVNIDITLVAKGQITLYAFWSALRK